MTRVLLQLNAVDLNVSSFDGRRGWTNALEGKETRENREDAVANRVVTIALRLL